MSVPTFVPPIPPSPGTLDEPEIRTLSADFGDGYTQDGPDGLNNIRSQLNLQWDVLTPTQADQIIAFIVGRRGTDPFYYQPATADAPILWTCKKWTNKADRGGLRVVTLQLRQSFNIV